MKTKTDTTNARTQSSRQRPVPLVLTLLMAVLLIGGALAVAGCKGNSGSDKGGSGKVPNLVGLTKADASQDITEAGFLVGDVTYANSDTVYLGNVISQDPAADTSGTAGSKVNYVVSSGKANAKQIAVPDLKGMTQTQAEDALASVGLVAKPADPVYDTSVKIGTVFKQSTAAGTQVIEGATVTFTVALGQETVTVPDLAGKDKDTAIKALTDAGFSADTKEVYDSSVAAKNVVAQNPAAGTQVVAGSKVVLDISLGAKPTGKVAVPNLMTLTYEEAQASLKSAGLACNASGDLSGTVVAQSVAAGTQVDAGSTVTITLQGATTQVLVPAITGMSLTDAINALAGVKLFTLVGSGDLTGTVASVSPAEGTAVDVYSVVTITMAATPTPPPTPTTVTVPDLSGMKLPGALKTLEGFGLYAAPNGTDFNGSVTAQDPAAGTTVNVGSEVTISLDMLLSPATTTSNTGPA